MMRTILMTVAAVALMACGSTVDGSGSGGEGGQGAGGGNGGNGASGGNGGNNQCDAFDDESGTAVTFRIHNDTDRAIYIPTSCGTLFPEITRIVADDAYTYGNFDQSCSQSCDDLQDNDLVACDAACALLTYRIEQGAVLEYTWNGTGFENVEMPGACWFNPSAGTTCTKIVDAPMGNYEFDITAYDACEGDCDCDNGECWGDAAGMSAKPFVPAFAYPGDAVVDVVFDICTFAGCP